MSSGTSLVPYTKKSTTMPAIDATNDSLPPLDFSYLKLTCLQDIRYEEPRPYLLKKKGQPSEYNKEEKSGSRCLRLNNNALTDIAVLPEIITNMFKDPSSLGWLDLSFNQLTNIDPILCQMTGLEILYLHGNQISNINEVEKLQSLTNLKKLTFHGNPIEKAKGYRQYCLFLMPKLNNFDFSAVTKADRKTAETWEKMNKMSKKKKREA